MNDAARHPGLVMSMFDANSAIGWSREEWRLTTRVSHTMRCCPTRPWQAEQLLGPIPANHMCARERVSYPLSEGQTNGCHSHKAKAQPRRCYVSPCRSISQCYRRLGGGASRAAPFADRCSRRSERSDSVCDQSRRWSSSASLVAGASPPGWRWRRQPVKCGRTSVMHRRREEQKCPLMRALTKS